MAHLLVTLAVQPRGIFVGWRLNDVEFDVGDCLGQLPVFVAGTPSVDLKADDIAASDGLGALDLRMSLREGDEGELLKVWEVGRSTRGPVDVSYLARPITEPPTAATPPLDLRAEGVGICGALKCLLVLPPGPENLTFELHWNPPEREGGPGSWLAVSSLGEGIGSEGQLVGEGLEFLADTYVMCGELADRHYRDGQLSTWWLAPTGVDIESFTARLGATYRVMSQTFDAPEHPYRVFLRTHPHRGATASAHPASFAMAVNPVHPPDIGAVHETIAHELVHEWLRLDGPAEEVTWFVEGAADYYSLVLPLRSGMIDDDAFLRAVNTEAREAYANPRRGLSLRDAQREFFSDFLAHRLPYARGMFYLADLDSRSSGKPRPASPSTMSSETSCEPVARANGSALRHGVTESERSSATTRCRRSMPWSSPVPGGPTKTASVPDSPWTGSTYRSSTWDGTLRHW